MGCSGDCEWRSVDARGSVTVDRGVELCDGVVEDDCVLLERSGSDSPTSVSNAWTSTQFMSTVPHVQGAYNLRVLRIVEDYPLIESDVELSSTAMSSSNPSHKFHNIPK